jgi:hypothetical protein
VSFSKGRAVLGNAVSRAIRLALWLIAATALLMPAACTTHRTGEQKAQVDPEWWLDTLDIAYDRYVDAIIRSCPPQGFLSNKKCVKAKIVESFARQSSADTHCQTEDPTGGFLLCIDLITATERTYRALGIDPQSVTDWDDPYEALATVSQLVATRLTSKCPDVAQGDCVSQEVADLFAVTLGEADRCALSSEVKRQVNCAIGLIRIEGYRSALLYAG